MAKPLSPAQLKQRRDAAAKRRKSKDFEVGMTAFKRAGITSGKDVVRSKAGIAGKDSATHAKLLNAIRLAGGKIGRVEEDGSAVATLPNGRKVKIASPEADGKFFDARGKAWDARTHSLEKGVAKRR